MQAPRLPASFSLFKQRPSRGFNLVTRYYDAEKEERAERIRKAGAGRDTDARRAEERHRFTERMRHSWQRESSDRAHLVRLVVIMGLVMTVLFFIIRSFSLLDFWNG